MHLAAADNENPAIIITLIEAGAKLDAQASDGSTPLHLAAASNENPDIIITLIEAGAKLDAQDSSGSTALSFLKDNEKLKYLYYELRDN